MRNIEYVEMIVYFAFFSNYCIHTVESKLSFLFFDFKREGNKVSSMIVEEFDNVIHLN